jgi:hypothetical protein
MPFRTGVGGAQTLKSPSTQAGTVDVDGTASLVTKVAPFLLYCAPCDSHLYTRPPDTAW